jgi:hypothetical protein
VVLTVIAVWLGLSALATVACALVARSGLREDGRRGYLDKEHARLLDAAPEEDRPRIPRPRVASL